MSAPGPSAVRRLLWPSLTTAAMLALAVGLGVWQMQRLAWKTDLLAAIDQGEAAPAVPLPADPRPFTKVIVEGRLRQDLAASYGIEVRTTNAGPILGTHLLNPLERSGAPPIIVDRGWMPAEAPRGSDTKLTAIEGYIRPAEYPKRFGAADDPAARRFYALDPVAIGASLGLAQVAPYTLVAVGTVPRGTYPEPVRTLPRPANNHFIYALTWFGLAGALLAVFGVYARRLLRAPP